MPVYNKLENCIYPNYRVNSGLFKIFRMKFAKRNAIVIVGSDYLEVARC